LGKDEKDRRISLEESGKTADHGEYRQVEEVAGQSTNAVEDIF
jgi:hypothetical protein